MIEETIDLLLSRLPCSDEINLSGFVLDCENFFSDAKELFGTAQVESTMDPRRMVRIHIALAESVPSLQRLNEALQAAWRHVAYSDYQAAACTWYREAMVLRFVTASPRSRLLVTGEVVASGGGYASAVADFERDYGSIAGKLPSQPV